MSSNRNNNNYSEYICKKNENNKSMDYKLANYYGENNNKVHMFTLGSIPTKMSSNNFSYNSIDIESKLRGIRSNDLEFGSFNPDLQKKDFYSMDVFENNLKENVYMPPPIFHDSNERKGFHNI